MNANAIMLDEGDGIAVNKPESAKYYQIAGDKGDEGQSFAMQFCYLTDKEVK